MPIIRPLPLDEVASKTELPAFGTGLDARTCEELCVAVALRGAGSVSPNPMVGAVAVDSQHRFLAAAAHIKCGENHAERNLIEGLTARGQLDRLQGGTVYVSLEPCAHHGRTPPCADLLASLPIARVIYGSSDPNPKVNGRGLDKLEKAGIAVEQSDRLEQLARFLVERAHVQLTRQTPFIGLKAAVSIDGVYASKKPEPIWITGERARTYGHWLRHVYDGILVGARTLFVDNPTLTARHPDLPEASPHAFVFDPKGELFSRELSSREPSSSELGAFKLFQRSAGAQTTILTTDEVIAKTTEASLPTATASIATASIGVSPDRVDRGRVMAALAGAGCQSVLLEGGAGVWSYFLAQGLVDKLHLFQAPRIIGSDAGRIWSAGLAVVQNVGLRDPSITPLREDWLIEAGLAEQTQS